MNAERRIPAPTRAAAGDARRAAPVPATGRTRLRTAALALLLALGSAAARAEVSAAASGTAPLVIDAPRAARDADAAPDRFLQIDTRDAELRLQALVRLAAARSALVAAGEREADASRADLDETRGARLPRVDAGARAAFAGASTPWLGNGRQTSASLGASVPVYDFGRQSALEDWRRRLAEAAALGVDATREAVALEAATLAVERERARAQAGVQRQYALRMAALADRIGQIVAVDRGRASELVQARKTQAQAELARDAALATQRQIETRLRRFVGDDLAPADGIAPALIGAPDFEQLSADARDSRELRQLRAQADAAGSQAEAVAAGQKPQVSLAASRSVGRNGELNAGAWMAGIQLSYTIFSGQSDVAARRAALERAAAARERVTEANAQRQTQLLETFDQLAASFDRARGYGDVVRASDELREATFQQWAELGRRSLFDVMSAEADHYALRAAYLNSLFDGYQANLRLRSLGPGLLAAR
ncbi:TolC family protein [Derxia gummosa]|uniref:TolC family protein n=1 Tax=Derxia gummosa DSM 723 TaxID=1121388 RepID=A0A8B6X5E3_9BURK|nr:TolC family protein [Derxia gummosa]